MDELSEFTDGVTSREMLWAIGCFLISLIDYIDNPDSFEDGELEAILDGADNWLIPWRSKFMEEIIAICQNKQQ